MTVFGLYLFIVGCALGGVALDATYAFQMRTRLQAAADSVAHAALVARQTQSEEDAIEIALAVAEANLPASRHGTAIRADDIVFGVWDEITETFTTVPGSRAAVLVDARRIGARENAVPTFLLKLVGIDAWDIVRRSIFETYSPNCFNEGFVAEAEVDVTSNNYYHEGFCIHSNQYVELNQNNELETGVIVSMPDRRDLVIPASGFERNEGLEEALRDAYYDTRIHDRIAGVHDDMVNPASENYPEFITSLVPIFLNHRDQIDEDLWQEGHIHMATCPRDTQRLRISGGVTLRGGILLTNCEVAIGSGSALENVRLYTSSRSADSITGAANIRIGAADGCDADGGTIIATEGGVRVPRGLQLFGSRILARDDVQFAAAVNGLSGSSIIAGGSIDGTANGDVGFCHGEGLPPVPELVYFRMVR